MTCCHAGFYSGLEQFRSSFVLFCFICFCVSLAWLVFNMVITARKQDLKGLVLRIIIH